MSMQETPEAQLADFRGPFYPLTIEEVAKAYVGCGNLDASRVELAARRGYAFHSIRWNVITQDGYQWYAVATFGLVGGRGAIALPRARDLNRRDNVPLDRSPAVYLKGTVSTRDAARIAERFARALRSVQG